MDTRNILKTRIRLKYDDLSNWNAVEGSFIPLKGEVILASVEGQATLEHGSVPAPQVLMKVGDGERPLSALNWITAKAGDVYSWAKKEYLDWTDINDEFKSQLSSYINNVSPKAKHYEAVVAYGTDYNVDDLFGTVTSDVAGDDDIFIVKQQLGTTAELSAKYQYTSYVYDTELGGWRAMDGNYSAENVYFRENISLAGSYTAVGNIAKPNATGTLSCAGWSVKALFEEMLDKTVQPTIGKAPSASVTLTNAGVKEVGTSFTPSWSVSYTQGKYNTPWNNSTVNDGTAASAYDVEDTNGNTATTASGSFAAFTVVDNTNYKVSADVDYSAGSVAKNNKGVNSNPVVQRAASTVTATASSAVTAFRRCFWGYRTVAQGALDTANLTSAQIRNEINAGTERTKTATAAGWTKSSAGADAFITSFKVLKGTKQLIFAVPHGLDRSKLKIRMNSPSAGDLTFTCANNVRVDNLVSVMGTDSVDRGDADKYDVWYYTSTASFAADTDYSITYSAS